MDTLYGDIASLPIADLRVCSSMAKAEGSAFGWSHARTITRPVHDDDGVPDDRRLPVPAAPDSA